MPPSKASVAQLLALMHHPPRVTLRRIQRPNTPTALKSTTSLLVVLPTSPVKPPLTVLLSADTVVGTAEAHAYLDDSYGLDADFSSIASDAQLTGLNNVANLASAQATSDGEARADSDTDASVGAYLHTSEIGGVATIGGQSTTNSGAQAVNVSGSAKAEESTTNPQVFGLTKSRWMPMPPSKASSTQPPALLHPQQMVMPIPARMSAISCWLTAHQPQRWWHRHTFGSFQPHLLL